MRTFEVKLMFLNFLIQIDTRILFFKKIEMKINFIKHSNVKKKRQEIQLKPKNNINKR